jgi:hypothetical protein
MRRCIHPTILGLVVRLALGADLAFAVAPDPPPAPSSAATAPVASAAGAPHLEARELRGSSASQAWDFVAQFDSGHLLFTRFLVTNIGPGEQNAAAIWHLVDPDGEVHEFHNGRRRSGWNLENQGHRLRVGSSVLTLRGAEQGILIDKKKVRIDVRFSIPSQVVDEVATGAHRLVLVSFSTPLEASVWHSGMGTPIETTGFVAISLTEEQSAGAALRRVEFVSLDPEYPLFASQVLNESGQREAWAWISRGEQIIRAQGLTVCDRIGGGSYPTPGRIVASTGGDRLEIEVEAPFLRYDPLSILPHAFQTVLAWFYTPQRFWAWGSFATHETPESKRGVARVTFNNSLPTSLVEALQEAPECRPASAS